LELQIVDQVIEEQVAFIEPVQAVEQGADRALGLPEDRQERSCAG
jgi:hypothetical protein